MIKPLFTPETDIENCLTNDFNIEIYEALTENKGRKLLFDPLDFINLLYEQNLIVIANKAKPLSVIENLLQLNLNKEQLYFLLLHLLHLINIVLSENGDDNRLLICHNFINKEFKKLEIDLFPNDEGEKVNIQNADQQALKNVPFIGALLNNLNLDETILDYYYRLVRQPTKREEVSQYHVGNLNRYNSPYQVSIYGAFVNMNDWEFLQVKIDSKYPPFDEVSESEFETAKQQYAKGFKKGYFNFEKDIVEVSPFQESSNRAQIIFDFAKGRMFPSSGFPERFGKNIHILDGWEDAGEEGGHIYRAWYLILQNHNTFAPFFEKWAKKKTNNKGKIKKKLTKTFNDTGLEFEDYAKRVCELIRLGENKRSEFKSTLRYCLNQKSPQQNIEHSILKTIAAFLNSDGGTLLVGVDDNGNILGLDNDYSTFGQDKNVKDEWVKHFDNITGHAFSNALMSNIKLEFAVVNEKTVAIVDVSASTDRVFMKSKVDANKKQFYVRRNGSTIELDSEETLAYVKQKWG